jgi:hypothetical protein
MKSSAKARRVHRSTVASNFKNAPGMRAELTHFNNARRYVGALLIIGANLSLIGLGLIGAVYAPPNVDRYPNLIIPSAFALLGAALLITAGGFLSAGIVTYIRGRLLESDRLAWISTERNSANSRGG